MWNDNICICFSVLCDYIKRCFGFSLPFRWSELNKPRARNDICTINPYLYLSFFFCIYTARARLYLLCVVVPVEQLMGVQRHDYCTTTTTTTKKWKFRNEQHVCLELPASPDYRFTYSLRGDCLPFILFPELFCCHPVTRFASASDGDKNEWFSFSFSGWKMNKSLCRWSRSRAPYAVFT